MTEPQVWVVIGVLFAFLTATLTITTHTITVQIGSLRTEMSAKFETVNEHFNGMQSEIDARFTGMQSEMNARFDTVDVRIAGLDRDVQALTNKVFGAGQS